MKILCLLTLLATAGVLAQETPPPAEVNVNERYTVESVEITGEGKGRLSQGLRDDLNRLVGEKFNQKALDELVERIRKERPGRTVTTVVTRGDKPEHVKIAIDIRRKREWADLTFSKALYHSRQGWSVKAIGDFEIEPPVAILFGLVSDADELLERYAGIAAGFHTKQLVTDRLRLRFLFETYHHQWNRATLEALDQPTDVPGIYRTRKTFTPTLSVALAKPLTLTAGASFNFIQTQFPTARIEEAHAATGELRLRHSLRDPQGNRHHFDAAYNIRAATRTFESDFVYTRHHFDFGYRIAGRRQSVLVHTTGGILSGRAPLFERFTLGNSSTLRGWHKFDVAPLGGNRMVHNSLEYNLKGFQVFYDAGAVWDHGRRAVAKHSAGFGIRDDGPERGKLVMPGFFATLAFPIKSGRAEPIFMIGVNF
jgi:hypothetical protein